jgi:hypothetical protein
LFLLYKLVICFVKEPPFCSQGLARPPPKKSIRTASPSIHIDYATVQIALAEPKIPFLVPALGTVLADQDKIELSL